MNVIYSDTPLPPVTYDKDGNSNDPLYTFNRSIFLAGPTPRSPLVKSWRPKALEILENLKFDGYVLVPERRDWDDGFDYVDQVDWEYNALHRCRHIVFWIPRSFPHMPALTTNVEFGYYLCLRPNTVYYGRPVDSEKNKYLDWIYKKKTGSEPETDLAVLLNCVSLK